MWRVFPRFGIKDRIYLFSGPVGLLMLFVDWRIGLAVLLVAVPLLYQWKENELQRLLYAQAAEAAVTGIYQWEENELQRLLGNYQDISGERGQAMGLIRSLMGRRVAAVDRARVDLFDLDEGEFPVEAQALTVNGGWPVLMGLPVEPGTAEDLTVVSTLVMEGFRMLMPFPCVGLLTSTHFRWTPHRSYRRLPVYTTAIDQVLSEGEPIAKGIYGTFSNPLLGTRAVRVEAIKQITVRVFFPDFAMLDVHLTDNCEIEGPGPWPIYEQSQIADLVPYMYRTGNADDRYLQLIASGSAALNVASTWSQAFEYLAIPIQLEDLDEEGRQAWDDWHHRKAQEAWMPLSQRLSIGVGTALGL